LRHGGRCAWLCRAARSLAIYQLLKALLIPPASLILLAMAGVLLARPRRGAAAGLAFGALLALYALSTPLLGWWLLSRLETQLPAPAARSEPAQAVVVLSAGVVLTGPEFGGPTIDALGLQRLRYAARLARQSGFPILVSGGRLREIQGSVAGLMAQSLKLDFGVDARWLEERSTTTHENAEFSAPLLRDAGVTRVLLVTHAWHMPRAQAAFEAAGLVVSPAPTGFTDPPGWRLALVPSTTALKHSYYALHELGGRVWYRVAFGA